MQLGYVILYVPDVTAALEFYRQAFGLERRFLAEGGDYGELETGATSLAFAAETLAASNGLTIRPNRRHEAPGAAELALVTDDVAAAYRQALDAGAEGCVEPTVKPWGQTVAYVRDGNGFLVELCTPIG